MGMGRKSAFCYDIFLENYRITEAGGGYCPHSKQVHHKAVLSLKGTSGCPGTWLGQDLGKAGHTLFLPGKLTREHESQENVI